MAGEVAVVVAAVAAVAGSSAAGNIGTYNERNTTSLRLYYLRNNSW